MNCKNSMLSEKIHVAQLFCPDFYPDIPRPQSASLQALLPQPTFPDQVRFIS